MKDTHSWIGRWCRATGGAAPAMILFAGAALSIAGAAGAREPLGVYRGWAAFRDGSPTRCYALSAPAIARRPASAAVGYQPERRTGAQLHIRLARPARAGSAILLTVDDRLFQLVGRGADAWARGPVADRAIVAAIRTGVEMNVVARDENGRALDHRYLLTGAASAIDAAAVACRRSRDE